MKPFLSKTANKKATRTKHVAFYIIDIQTAYITKDSVTDFNLVSFQNLGLSEFYLSYFTISPMRVADVASLTFTITKSPIL